jgi:hypothetical protein
MAFTGENIITFIDIRKLLFLAEKTAITEFNQILYVHSASKVFQKVKILSIVEKEKSFIARTYVKYHVYKFIWS